jgi:hypothetical protein
VSELITGVMAFGAPPLAGACSRTQPPVLVRAAGIPGPAWFSLRAQPAAADRTQTTDPAVRGQDVHVRSCLEDRAQRLWYPCSDVLYHAVPVANAADVIEAMQTYPGAAVCAAATSSRHLVLAIRWHGRTNMLRGDAVFALDAATIAALGSAVHAWLAAGFLPHALTDIAFGCERTIRLTDAVPGHTARSRRG